MKRTVTFEHSIAIQHEGQKENRIDLFHELGLPYINLRLYGRDSNALLDLTLTDIENLVKELQTYRHALLAEMENPDANQ